MGLPAVDVSLDKNAGPAPVKSSDKKAFSNIGKVESASATQTMLSPGNQSTDRIIEILDATADPSGLHPYIMQSI